VIAADYDKPIAAGRQPTGHVGRPPSGPRNGLERRQVGRTKVSRHVLPNERHTVAAQSGISVSSKFGGASSAAVVEGAGAACDFDRR